MRMFIDVSLKFIDFLLMFIDFHWFLVDVSLIFNWFSLVFNDFLIFYCFLMDFHWFSLIFIDFHWFSSVLYILRRLVGHLAPGEAWRGGCDRLTGESRWSFSLSWGFLGLSGAHVASFDPPRGSSKIQVPSKRGPGGLLEGSKRNVMGPRGPKSM